MSSINIYEAKTQLSKLVDAAASGETVIIAKAGRPVAKLTRIQADETPMRIGFLADTAHEIPDDFDRMGEQEIAEMFGGGA